MKKNIKLLVLLLVAVLSVGALMTGCSKGGGAEEKPTLEQYIAEHPEAQEEIDAAFNESGLDGNVVIEGNNILMTVDITSLLGEGMELDDATKQLLQESFDSAFDESEADLQSSIADIEKSSGIDGVTMQVVVIYSGETVFDRTFASK